MPAAEPTVFVVDDDAAARDAAQVLLKSVGRKSEAYATAEEVLADYDPKRPGCLVLDIRMPGMGGLELQRRLNTDGNALPIIMVTGHGDVPMAVGAMHRGAIDFIEKPIRGQALLESIREAIGRDAQSRRREAERAAAETRLATLSAREREVLDLVIAGKQSKVIATELGISQKTVEFRRSQIMTRLHAGTVADLMRRAHTTSE